MSKSSKSTPLPLLTILFGLLTGFTNPPANLRTDNRIVGLWETDDRDMRVEMIARNGQYAGRLVWFLCEGDDPSMSVQRDTENPDPALRNRLWQGMTVVDNLTCHGNGEWGGGSVYDPNTGHTFDATVRLTAPDQLVVRGYWKVSWLGKSLRFHRVTDVRKQPDE